MNLRPATFSRLLTLLLGWHALGAAAAGSLAEFRAANQLYDQGDFAAAIAAYERIEPATAHVLYNLGNAHFRAGQPGHAALQYERALRLAPRDPDLQANLQLVRQQLGAAEPGGWRARVATAAFSRSLREWTGIALSGFALGWAGLGWLLATRRARALVVIFTTGMFVGWGIATAALVGRLRVEQRQPQAIVLAAATDARFAPAADATVHFTLAEGAAVRIRETRGGWQLVERADGQQGWAPTDRLGRIHLP